MTESIECQDFRPTRELPPPPRSVTGRPFPSVPADPPPVRRHPRDKAKSYVIDPETGLLEPESYWIDLDQLKASVEVHLAEAERRTALTPDQRALADASVGLAVAFAAKRWRKSKRAGLTFAQVIAAARLGLEDAVARYDPAKGKIGGLAWGHMQRRIVELHRSWDDDKGLRDDEEPRGVGRANRWPFEKFEWPTYPDVIRELNRLADLPGGPFTHQDLDVLRVRARDGMTQAEAAAELGLTLSAVRRIEKRAAARVRPVAERLRERSTDRYLLSVLSHDEILRVYGRESPSPPTSNGWPRTTNTRTPSRPRWDARRLATPTGRSD